MSKYHLKHQGPQIDALLDKADTALQEHQDISHLASFADLQAGLVDKVDKIAGKQLTTEDFTTALKEKLESLSNYNDANIKASIQSLQSQLNTLVDGDATSAIDTFNEIIAFLSSVEDTESLSSIIASIEQQIADKQDKIDDLNSIREGAAKGATALQEHQQLKTINGESIVGSGNITIQGGSGGSSGGSGITIVDDVSKLDPNATLGTLAAVVEPGSIQESSFRDLYQPDASMLDQNTGTLTAPELLSSVSSVSVFVPKDVTSLGFEPVEAMIYLVSRDFSMTSQNMAMVQIMRQGVMAITRTGGYDTYQQLVLAEFSQDTMSYTIHNDQVDAFNAVLANGMDWCYFGDPQAAITEEQFATIDLFIKAVAGIPSKAHVYLKKDNWEELYAKDFEKLRAEVNSNTLELASLTSSIPTKVSQLENDAGYASQFPYEQIAHKENLTPLNGSRYFFTTSFGNRTFILDNLTIGDSFTAVGFCIGYKLTLDFCFSSNKSAKRSIVLDSDVGLTKLEITLSATNSDAPEVYVSSTKLPLRSFKIRGDFNEFTYDQTYGSCVYLNGKRPVPGEVVSSGLNMELLVILNDTEDFTTLVNKFAEVIPSKKIYAHVDDTYIGVNTSGLEIIEIHTSSRLSTIAVDGLLYSCSVFSIHSLEQWCNLTVETGYNRNNVFNDPSFLYIGEDRVSVDLIIPVNITKINLNAFSGLDLNSIVFEGDVPKLEKNYYCDAPEFRNHISVRDLKDVNHLGLLLPESYNVIIKISEAPIKYYTINYPQAPILRSTTINEVHITKDCYKIPDRAFYNCKYLNKVTFDNSVEIGRGAFSDCSSLKEITIPANCTFDNTQSVPFSGSGLRKAAVLEGNSLKYLFWHCKELEEVQLSDLLTIIESYAFASCEKLHTINIPENCRKIEYSAFQQCKSLTSLFFPKAVLEIEDESFPGCTGMKVYDFSTHEEIPAIGSTRVFTGDHDGYHIVVPDSLYDEWIAATNWITYTNRIIKKSDWDTQQTTE
ncbi:MAG: leucine-rich repeat protein [Paludibacteraceae bacterium]|nr:leucine-rich repeat protein [Paludibacteraceae bacterium]